MSTLTSPSVVTSPNISGYSQYISSQPTSRPPYYITSASPSSRPLAASPSVKTLESSSHQSPHLRPAPRSSSRLQYADAGTQYSPEGSPPTASGRTTSGGPSASNKRKQDSQHHSMSPAATVSGVPASPPLEPKLREAPVKGQERNTAEEDVDQKPEKRASDFSVTAKALASAGEAKAKRQRTESEGVKVMPIKYEDGNPKELGVLIANMLMELIRQNDTIPLRDGKLTRFHSRAPPGISCHDYLLRLIQHATLSPPILLSMVYYIDRLCALYPAFTISSLTVHRFLITAATVASKGLSDSFWTNPTYARIGGISVGELATLELDFLQKVQWRIVPKPETLTEYYVSLVQRSEGHVMEGEEEEDESDEMETDPT